MSKQTFKSGFVSYLMKFAANNPKASDYLRKTIMSKKADFGFTPRPPATVGDVLTGIGLAQVNGIGTPDQRRDAFGRIVGSGIPNNAPATSVLGMIGGGILGNAITGMFTNRPLVKAIGTGIGAYIGGVPPKTPSTGGYNGFGIPGL